MAVMLTTLKTNLHALRPILRSSTDSAPRPQRNRSRVFPPARVLKPRAKRKGSAPTSCFLSRQPNLQGGSQNRNREVAYEFDRISGLPMQESGHPHRKSGSSRYRDEYFRSYRQGTILLAVRILFTSRVSRGGAAVGRCHHKPRGWGLIWAAMVPFTADIYWALSCIPGPDLSRAVLQ